MTTWLIDKSALVRLAHSSDARMGRPIQRDCPHLDAQPARGRGPGGDRGDNNSIDLIAKRRAT